MQQQQDLYELHVLRNDRWSLAERFPAAERNEAIFEAQRHLASPDVEAVRVIREAWDEASQLFKQRTIYRNGKQRDRRKPALAVFEDAPVRRPPIAAAARPAPAPPAPPPSMSAALPQPMDDQMARALRRYATATASGLLGGAGGALLFSTAEGSGSVGVASPLVAAAALAMFIACFVAAYYLLGEKRTAGPAVAESGDPAPAAAAAEPQPERPSGAEMLARAAEAMGAAARARGSPPTASPPRPETPGDVLLQFMRDCLAADATKGFFLEGEMSSRTRLGCYLFLLGAGEACLQTKTDRWEQDEIRALAPIIAMALECLGTDGEKAAAFAERIGDYRRDERYRLMIDAGYAAMSRFITGLQIEPAALADALTEWHGNRPNGDQLIAILATELDVPEALRVSTAGDAVALGQSLDLVVGTVLRACQGHVVKQTGMGLLAMFPNLADGVRAAALIQRQVSAVNAGSDGGLLGVRIGVAAGPAATAATMDGTVTDGDRLGQMVMTAARLALLAVAGEALVCEQVAGALISDPANSFRFDQPRYDMIEPDGEPQAIYPLLWFGAADLTAAPIQMTEPGERRVAP